MNEELTADWQKVIDALKTMMDEFSRALGGVTTVFLGVSKAMRPIIADAIRRHAIENLDIPESDIRYVDVKTMTVVLWNRRRIKVML